VRRKISLFLKLWRIRNLDEVSKQLIDGERRYVGAFLQYVEYFKQKKWDPKQYVNPQTTLYQRRLEPVDPILVLLETISSNQSAGDETLLERRETVRKQRVHDLFSVAKRVGGLVILGEPGCGKTTCLLQLGIEIADRALWSSHPTPSLPIFLPLNEFTEAASLRATPDPVLGFVTRQIQQQAASIPGADISARLKSLIRDGRAVFIFDALDEMPRDGYHERFRALSRFAKACMNSNKGNIFIFSCRKLDYVG
jgi:predicted NACHT family NTPase